MLIAADYDITRENLCKTFSNKIIFRQKPIQLVEVNLHKTRQKLYPFNIG